MDSHEVARSFRKEPTHAEARLWKWLRNRRFGAHKFRRQHPVGGYILDFYCAELKLAIEMDGEHHGTPWMAEYDGVRDERLRKRGIRVIRIRNVDLIQDPQSVEAFIAMTIAECL